MDGREPGRVRSGTIRGEIKQIDRAGEGFMEYVHGGDIYTYGDVLDFSVNVNPYGPSEEVLEAARNSMTDVKLYPDNRCRKLRK